LFDATGIHDHDTVAVRRVLGGHVSIYETPGGSPADDGGIKEKAADVAGDATSHAGEVADRARQQGMEVAGEAKAQARDLVHEARGRLRDQADEQAQIVAAQLGEAADDLLAMSGSAEHPDHPVVEVTRQLGERARSVSGRLESGGFGGVMADAKRFARRRPLAFIGTSLVAGIVVGRVLRNADTAALTQAAKPDGNGPDSSGAGSNGHDDELAMMAGAPTVGVPTVGVGI